MARLRSSHPWNAGYSIPQNVLDEPYGQGTIITKQVARGTISALQPEYVVGGAGASANLGSLGSDSFGSIGGSSLRSGSHGSLSGTSLDGSSLSNGVQAGGASDPIVGFGKQAAALIMNEVKMLPASADRVEAMRRILESIDAGLYSRVAQATVALQKKTGAGPTTSMEAAIAALMSSRYLEQLKQLGKTGRAPTTGPLGMGLGSADGLGGFFDDVWGGIKSGAGAVGSAAKKVGSGIAGLACKVANNPGTAVAAGYSGGAAGATGAQLASQMCGGNQAAAPTYVPPASSGPGMGTVLLIGGGLLAAVLLLRK